MPTSRVYIRLEIEDDPINFSYSAQDLKISFDDKENSLDRDNIISYRGNRNVSKYIIESIHSVMDEEINNTSQNLDEIQLADGSVPDIPRVMQFFCGNPAVEIVEGILHLYKENKESKSKRPDSQMICMFSIPANFDLQDLIRFLAPVGPNLEQIKIVRPEKPNEYMALLKFRSEPNAHEFYDVFNNKPFNSIEPDICHLVYVAHIECVRSTECGGAPISGATELPVCAVCIEKMDESIEGILTILCNHTFHMPCLGRCEDTTCPVCRYVQTPVTVGGHTCSKCSVQEDLWICLICGIVGCGRYANGHANSHYIETSHTYAMQLGSNRVWDYAGENYVHRLVQNKVDGKLVEIDENLNHAQEEKMESLSLEYTYLLTSQLESQRDYFENKLQFLEEQKDIEVDMSKQKLKIAKEESLQTIEEKKILEKEKQVLEKRCNLLEVKVSKLTSELSDERSLNKCLRDNQADWAEKVSILEKRLNQKDQEITDMQEQLRDVMFYLETQQKIQSTSAETQEEIAEGKIVIQSNETINNSGKKGRKKR